MTARPRALLLGWYSFEQGEATAGDLLAGEAARGWLAGAGWDVDLATSSAFPDGTDWRLLDPRDYRLVVFTCGPLAGWQIAEALDRFAGLPSVAVDVSVLDERLAARFDAVLARDHDGPPMPDICLAVEPTRLPVVGVINTHPQPAYGRDGAERAARVVAEALRTYPAAVVELGTRVDPRLDPLEREPRSPAELESVLARLDALVTSRLHGLVLVVRNHVPTVAIDVVHGTGKMTAQAKALGWPHLIPVEALSARAVHTALDRCLLPDGRAATAASLARARPALEALRRRLVTAAAEHGLRGRDALIPAPGTGATPPPAGATPPPAGVMPPPAPAPPAGG